MSAETQPNEKVSSAAGSPTGRRLKSDYHKGMDATCAQDCAKKGQQVSLVTKTGEVYDVKGEVAADMNAKLVSHMSHTVALTGEVTDVKGVKTITVATAGLKMVSK